MTVVSARPERGSGSVLVAGCVVLLVVAALVLSWLGGLLVQRRRLESAADLAALAGAAAVVQGRDGCALAALVARRNDARLAGCRVAGGTVEVATVGHTRLPLGFTLTQRARARAGPAGYD